MKSQKTVWWMIVSIVCALVVGFAAGNFLSGRSFGRKLFLTPNNKINIIMDIINEDYVDTINMKDLTEKAIYNLIDELDPHSVYISNDELQDVIDDMDGHFGGVGIDYMRYKDTIVVVNVHYGSPASQAGMQAGDRIIQINGQPFVGIEMSNETLLKKMRGKVGSNVKMTIYRTETDSIIEYSLQRNSILMTSVKAAYEVSKGIGYIKIFDKFTHTTYDEFIQAITKLTKQGCTSFILDLRSNSGGSYDAAVQIINEFFPEGRLLVYTEGKSFPRIESVSDGSGSLADKPVVILIDQMSASASEIVAGSMQDNDRGLIIGRRSFGKGLVQNQIELSDGSAVRLTIARYFTPSGRNIQRRYELGKTSEYNQDWLDQLSNGESFHADSIKLDTASTYQTVHGRTVYGNGGIMPDIFVPLDTTYLTSYYLQLENKDMFNRFAFEYVDANRAFFRQFKDEQALTNYLKTQPILSEFIRYAELNGVKRRTVLIYRSSNQILRTALASIVNKLFGEEAFFRVYQENDADIARAIKAINDGEAHPKAIAASPIKIR
ncbi:MAG: S41 family peptidase [Candidatus Symbiothrix sp.]|jgi:carboxyl-terminal processing protease|nr:S41 family peptidase [Candidatus Symbiothrix sp.]